VKVGGWAREARETARVGSEERSGAVDRILWSEGRRKTSEMDEVEVEVEVRTKQCDGCEERGEKMREERRGHARHVRKTAFVSSFVLCPPFFLLPCLLVLGFRFCCPPPSEFQKAETEGDHCCHSVKRRKDVNHAIKYRNKNNWDWDWDTISTTGLDIPWSMVRTYVVSFTVCCNSSSQLMFS